MGYLFFQSWTNAFALHPLAPPHVVFGVASSLAFGIYVIIRGGRFRTGVYGREDICLFILILVLTFAAFMNPRGIDSIKYISAYVYTFTLVFIVIKGALYNSVSTKKIFDWLIIGVVFTALTSILELMIDYNFGVDIGEYFYRGREIIATYNSIPRSVAFATEPGILAFYLETLGLVAIWAIWNRSWALSSKAFCISVIVGGWIAAFSAGSIAALLVGGVVAIGIKVFRSQSMLSKGSIILISPFCIAGIFLLAGYAGDTFLGPIISKLSLEGGSARGRVTRWMEGLTQIAENPFVGEGPGTASARGEASNISWYIFLTVESGIVGLFPIIVFLLSKIYKACTSSVPGKYIFIISLCAGIAHLSVISTFFHPFLWTLIIIFEVINSRQKH